jgi:hypothetical protein
MDAQFRKENFKTAATVCAALRQSRLPRIRMADLIMHAELAIKVRRADGV